MIIVIIIILMIIVIIIILIVVIMININIIFIIMFIIIFIVNVFLILNNIVNNFISIDIILTLADMKWNNKIEFDVWNTFHVANHFKFFFFAHKTKKITNHKKKSHTKKILFNYRNEIK